MLISHLCRTMWRRFLVSQGLVAAPDRGPDEPLGWMHGENCNFFIHAVRADGRLVQRHCSNAGTYERAVHEAQRRASNPSVGTVAYFVIDHSGWRLYRADVPGR